MITLKDGTILRNLEEQVLENKQKIAKHWNVDRVLADFGIKMLGRFDNYDDIKDLDEGENYGNAYLIGTEEPYDVYVWTRADANAGQPVPYWLDIGPISLVGPQGPEGEQGPQGERGDSTKWYSSNLTPYNPDNYNLHDQWLNTTTGDVSEVNAYVSGQKYWRYTGNIKGPQGIQGPQGIKGERGPQGEPGPQGERGDVGGFINIWGILTQSSQLPTPASLNNMTVAYLVGTTMPYDLWIQVGENSATAIWQNTGPFNAAIAVSVGGVYQNVWDADTKLDKQTSTTNYRQIYMKTKDGQQSMIDLADAIPYRGVPIGDNSGRIFVGDPTADYHAANKVYVDNLFVQARFNFTAGSNYIIMNLYMKKSDYDTINSIETLAAYLNSKGATSAANSAIIHMGERSTDTSITDILQYIYAPTATKFTIVGFARSSGASTFIESSALTYTNKSYVSL